MDPFLDTYAYPQNLALDIEAELDYWRGCYKKMPFHKPGLPFETYVPAIKFGYDCYLAHYRDDLDLVLPALKQRYERDFPQPRRLNWGTCQRILRAVWEHIKLSHRCRRNAFSGEARDLGAATVR